MTEDLIMLCVRNKLMRDLLCDIANNIHEKNLLFPNGDRDGLLKEIEAAIGACKCGVRKGFFRLSISHREGCPEKEAD